MKREMEFPNVYIRYSPGWLAIADKFPGFYNEECYYILSDFLKENYKTVVIKRKAENLEAELEEVVKEEVNAEMESEIRSYESECEDGVQSEQFAADIESVFEFEW